MRQAGDAHTISRRAVLIGAGAVPVVALTSAGAASAAEWPEDLSISDLCSIYDAYASAQEAVLAISNQPRTPDKADDILFAERERFFDLMKKAVRALGPMVPSSGYQRDARARTLVHYKYINLGDQPEAFFDLAETAAKEIA